MHKKDILRRYQELVEPAGCGIRWCKENAFDPKWRDRLGHFCDDRFHLAFNMGKVPHSPRHHPLVLLYNISDYRYTLLPTQKRAEWRRLLESANTGRVDDYQHILNVLEISDVRAKLLGFVPPPTLDGGWHLLNHAWKDVLSRYSS